MGRFEPLPWVHSTFQATSCLMRPIRETPGA
jgi:hypothetical protein